MTALIGFVFGYVLGARAGEQGYEELKAAWQTIAESEEFQGLVATGLAFAQKRARAGRGRSRGASTRARRRQGSARRGGRAADGRPRSAGELGGALRIGALPRADLDGDDLAQRSRRPGDGRRADPRCQREFRPGLGSAGRPGRWPSPELPWTTVHRDDVSARRTVPTVRASRRGPRAGRPRRAPRRGAAEPPPEVHEVAIAESIIAGGGGARRGRPGHPRGSRDRAAVGGRTRCAALLLRSLRRGHRAPRCAAGDRRHSRPGTLQELRRGNRRRRSAVAVPLRQLRPRAAARR